MMVSLFGCIHVHRTIGGLYLLDAVTPVCQFISRIYMRKISKIRHCLATNQEQLKVKMILRHKGFILALMAGYGCKG
ncbi:hypothetical protein, partial [Herbaspirillum chlorophenolicum]